VGVGVGWREVGAVLLGLEAWVGGFEVEVAKEEAEEVALVNLDDWVDGEDAGAVLDPYDDDDSNDDGLSAPLISAGFGCRGSNTGGVFG
jgi:hypothetical protein